MKVAVFFLVVGFCLVAVNAATIENFDQGLLNKNDIELPEEPVEIGSQTLMIFTKFFWVVWKALRFLKGINCSIKNVMYIQKEVIRYPNELFACNVELTEPVTKVVQSLDEVAILCDNILNMNTKICNRENPNPTESDESSDSMSDDYQEIDGQTVGFFKCTFKLLKAFDALEHKLVATAKLMTALPDAAFKTGGCMGVKTKNLTTLFTDFPSNVKTCSQLK